MKTIKTFENFQDPNIKPKAEKIQISSYITKSDFFALRSRDEKNFIKKTAGKEFDKWTKDIQGNYVIETGDSIINELTIPKKFIYEITQK